VAGAVARDATTALLQRSATSLTWRLFCQGHVRPEGRFCFLGIRTIDVIVSGNDNRETRRAITYDRCSGCRPKEVPPPPPIR
jgi:hypothetical protein